MRIPPTRRTLGLDDPGEILLEQVDRHHQQDQILQQECRYERHGRKPTGRRFPGTRNKREDRERGNKAERSAQCAERAELLVPEPEEQQRTEGPFRGAQQNACPLEAQDSRHPEDQRAVRDQRQQSSDLGLPPLVIAKPREDHYHRSANEVVIEVALQEARPIQYIEDVLHDFLQHKAVSPSDRCRPEVHGLEQATSERRFVSSRSSVSGCTIRGGLDTFNTFYDLKWTKTYQSMTAIKAFTGAA
ncbi:protein of unknown function [Pararobbsia alpina]